MPGRLSLSQRLTGPDGLPTAAARLGVAGLMLIAAAAGYAASPRGGEPPAPTHVPVAASRLAGELPIAAPEPEPALGDAAAVPPLRTHVARRVAARRPAPAPAVPDPTPEPPVSEPLPEPTPAATPVATPAAPPPPAAPPKPRSTPAPTFDSSG